MAGWGSGQVKFFLVVGTIFYLVSLRLTLLGLPKLELSTVEEAAATGSTRKQVVVHPHVLEERRFANNCRNLQGQLRGRALSLQSLPEADWFRVLSAYMDTRHTDTHFVRLLVALHTSVKSRDSINIHCHVPVSIKRLFTAPAVLYEFNENHALPWGGYVFSCPLPPQLISSVPQCYVRVTNGPDPNDKNHLDVPLQRVSMGADSLKYNFTVCVPPLFGHVPEKQLVEFIEVTRRLGAQHFYFYDYNSAKSSPKAKEVLRHYSENEGLVTVRLWDMDLSPSGIEEIWYHGQMLAIHHCLYANMGISKYTMFQDIDELLVPQGAVKNWQQLMQKVDAKRDHCGYRFFSAFFVPEEDSIEDKSVFRIHRRTQQVSRVRTKCMVHPDLIFEMGIHHISKQNVEVMTPHNIQENIALLHHYRKCDSMFSAVDLCQNYVVDKHLLSFVKQLPGKVDKLLRTVQLKK